MNFLASLFAPIKHPFYESVPSDDHDNGISLALPPTISTGICYKKKNFI